MSTDTAPAGVTAKSRWRTYENGILLLLGFTFGLVFFDRNAVGVLGSHIIEDLGLTNQQFGMLSSGLALAWALSAYFIAAWSDALRARKPFVLISIIVFSVCSAISGLATSFLFLLVARVIMGIAEGPFLPVCLSIMNVESSPHRRGLNAGIMQNVFAALLGTTMAPIVLAWLAEVFNWRITFFLTALPGLICALLVWLYLKEPERGAPVDIADPAHKIGPGALAMLKEHNIRVCCVISIFMVSWFLVTLTFLQPFFVNYRGIPAVQTGGLISFMGFSTVVCGFLVPAFSDRIGRKPALIMFSFIGVVTPLAALFFDGPLWIMGVLLFIGWSGTGAFPIFMGVVPGETVSRAMAASSMGLVVCIGELVGGVAMPTLAGRIADQTSLAAAMVIVAVCAFCGGVAALFVKETARRRWRSPVRARRPCSPELDLEETPRRPARRLGSGLRSLLPRLARRPRPACSSMRRNLRDSLPRRASHSGSGTWPSVTVKNACIRAVIANGSITACFTPQANTTAKTSERTPAAPGNNAATPAAGASASTNTASVSRQTTNARKNAFFRKAL